MFVNSCIFCVVVSDYYSYQGVMQDLRLWWPKMKIGGIFAGHDYMTIADMRLSE